MLLKILLGVAVLLAVLVAIAAMQPKTFRIVRKATLQAPAAKVFAQVNDFHKWRAWSPWEQLDPALERKYEGPPAGAGAVYSWAGNKNVGEGRMTILESVPDERVRIKLEFFKPFAATNEADFTFQPDGDATTVTWSMTGDRNFMLKCMGLVMSMDKMVGGQFEEGLANLRSVVESTNKS
jgi:uncharacterized protein YndB with AHSA1/START domain